MLLLQEVQSDWAQSARRAIGCGDMDRDDRECPPFLKEWPALAMKLVLLHAASGAGRSGADTGRASGLGYKGLGATGLNKLYDRTLRREVQNESRRVKNPTQGDTSKNDGTFGGTFFKCLFNNLAFIRPVA